MSRRSLFQRHLGQLRNRIIGRPVIGRSGNNAIWSALEAASSPLAALMLAAGLVRALGTTEYGEIVVALAVSNLSAAINPGISATTIKFVAEMATDKEKFGLGRIITSSLLAVMTIDLLLLLSVDLLNVELSDVIFGRQAHQAQPHLGSVLLLAVGAVCFQQLDGVFAAALKGLEQFRQQCLVEMSVRAGQVVISVIAAWVSRDVRVVMTTYCGVCAVAVGVRWAVLRSAMNGVRVLAWPSRIDVSRLLRFGGWMWLNAAATMAFGTVDRIVVGRVSGTSAAAEYNVYMQLAQLVHFIPSSLLAFTFPLFSRLGADRQLNLQAIKSLYKQYFRLAALIGVGIALLLVLFKHLVLSFFGNALVHGPHDASFFLLIVSFVVLSFNVIPYCLGLGLGNARAVSLVTSFSMFAAIFLTLYLTPVYGMEGAAIARLAYGLGALALVFQAHGLLQER